MELFVAGCSTSWTERATSCYLVNNHILFDCGEGTIKNITKCCGWKLVKGVDNIFITHFHSDHLFGITPYIAQLVVTYPKTHKKLNIYGPKGIKKMINFFLPNSIYRGKLNLKEYLNIVEIKTFKEKFFVDDLEIECHKLVHGNFVDVGYIIKTKDGILGYTGDSTYDQNLVEFVKKCDTIICDVSANENSFSHMGVKGYKSLEKEFPNKTFYAVHCGDEIFDNAKTLGLNCLTEQTFYTLSNKKLKKQNKKIRDANLKN